MDSVQAFGPVSVFCSYSHADEAIRKELQKHLAPLSRLGLIEIWNDHRIDPGDEWKAEIDKNLKTADIILLLISPDFVASDYCYENEAKHALERHKQDQAIVIPVIVRSVDFHDLPFANLQMLPRNAVPVLNTARDNSGVDALLKEVAEGIRSAANNVIARRLSRIDLATHPGIVGERRMLEAAIAHEVEPGEFYEVAVHIGVTSSQSLAEILAADGEANHYSCAATDVRSADFEAKYPLTASGDLTSPDYNLIIVAPSLICKEDERRISLQPKQGSAIFTFFVMAEKEGVHRLRVSLHSKNFHVAEAFLKTTATTTKPPSGTDESQSELIAHVELILKAVAKAASAGSAGF